MSKIRLNKILKEFNIGIQTASDFLKEQGCPINGNNPNQTIDEHQYELLKKEYCADKKVRTEAEGKISKRPGNKGNTPSATQKPKEPKKPAVPDIPTQISDDFKISLTTKGHIDLDTVGKPAGFKAPEEKSRQTPPPAEEKTAPAAEPEKKKKAAEQPVQETATPETSPKEEDKETPTPRPTEEHTATAEKAPSTVEQPAAPIGEETDGIYKIHTQTAITGPKVVGSIDLNAINSSTRPKKRSKDDRRRNGQNRQGTAAAGTAGTANGPRKKRTRIGSERVDVNNAANQPASNGNNNGNRRRNGSNTANQANAANATGGSGRHQRERNRKAKEVKAEISEEDVAKQVKETLARLTNKQKGKSSKYRKEKREQIHARQEEERREAKAESKILKLTEFVTANELAQMMDVPVTKVIGTCMSIGIMVSINQRMDAETIDLVADEFGFKTEYVSADVQEAIAEEDDNPEDLQPRAPIVTVMGHVDHGKTSLLDHIRKTNVIAGEAGGITQHIGAYNVTLDNGRRITFLDTPGHEAFTAMRARGAQVTDIAIIIIAADDDIMPQTKEAISHAVAANVPIVFAINKIDKPHANPDKIKEGLAAMNFLVEDWGGKYQSQDISAKKGTGVADLLEKVLLEADMLELKANPNRKATGTVIESSLDKGRGYVATVLVSNGTLHQGDTVLAGTNFGRIKALFNERGQRIQEVGPSMAATLLGFNGAPQAGDQFHVMDTEQEAREIANRREQLQREQDLRTREVLTLEKLGKRLKLGSYHELNIIVKADVDGSVEALADSFIKLSTEHIVVKVIYKGVGQISENDVTLAAASEAIIVGFQVRPSQQARKLAERDGVEIRQYSVIYDAIEDVKEAMEGMLEPVIKEEVTANLEVRQVYHISKVGYVAGAYVLDGKVKRTDKARLIRDGIVIFTGEINDLKRFKDDVKEVNTNFECGISLTNCNDLKEGDIIETFQEVEVKQKL